MPVDELSLFHELSFYTLAHPDKDYFVHQHIVDAHACQAADRETKPIKLLFGLVGLYLYIECQYTGKEVQKAHMMLAKHKKNWPILTLPTNKGNIGVEDVLQSSEGKNRDELIRQWCESLWSAYAENHVTIRTYIAEELY
jgi:hypothetical protein